MKINLSMIILPWHLAGIGIRHLSVQGRSRVICLINLRTSRWVEHHVLSASQFDEVVTSSADSFVTSVISVHGRPTGILTIEAIIHEAVVAARVSHFLRISATLSLLDGTAMWALGADSIVNYGFESFQLLFPLSVICSSHDV